MNFLVTSTWVFCLILHIISIVICNLSEGFSEVGTRKPFALLVWYPYRVTCNSSEVDTILDGYIF